MLSWAVFLSMRPCVAPQPINLCFSHCLLDGREFKPHEHAEQGQDAEIEEFTAASDKKVSISRAAHRLDLDAALHV